MVSLVAVAAAFDGQLFGFVLLALIVGGFYTYSRYQRKQLLTTVEEVANDDSDPVIYLRSFHQETIDNSLCRRIRNAFFGESIPGVSDPNRAQEQRNLAKYMNQIGPYTAIGRPGEELPFPGARKVYVSDDEWQDVVGQWISRSQVVVLEPHGSGQGLSWEISHLIHHFRPERILIILPRESSDYETVRDYLNKILTKPLPQTVTRGIRLLTFTSDWEPLPIGSLYPFFKQNGFGDPKDIDIYF
jgi:hypothetical protein